MEWRAYKIICNPAMMITWTCGITMTPLNASYWQMGWFHVKFVILILLTFYHVW
ncbi:MAG: CopD family protein [Spirosomataceae bacterium]